MDIIKRRALLKAMGFGTLFFLPYRKTLSQCLTTSDILGPFYQPDMPFQSEFHPEGAPGNLLFISGKIYANDCETLVADAEVDVWSADDDGAYHDDKYRGVVKTDENGFYQFVTIYPGKYLNGNQFRPSHLHYKVRKKDVELTTQIYFEGDTSIPDDPWASKQEAVERIIPIESDDDGSIHGIADIYLDIDPIILGLHEEGVKRSQIINSLGSNKLVIYASRLSDFELIVYSLNGEVVLRKYFYSVQKGEQVIDMGNIGETGIKIFQIFSDNKLADTKRFLLM